MGLIVKHIVFLVVLTLMAGTGYAQQESQEELAKKLANPVSSLISVPIQINYDNNLGATSDGSVWKINIQPVIPFSLSTNWNLISRTILPIINQTDFPVKGQNKFGMGDIVQSLFFSPKSPTAGGLVWAIGPVFLIPTSSDSVLGSKNWGVGPTAVALKQAGAWTIGGLTNHIQSFAGDGNRADVSLTLLQPFLSYITKTRTTFSLSTETTYDWKAKMWTVPLNFGVSQLLQAGNQIFQISAGARYWAKSTNAGAKGWGGRFTLTLLFPR